jgi:hypothetical protein
MEALGVSTRHRQAFESVVGGEGSSSWTPVASVPKSSPLLEVKIYAHSVHLFLAAIEQSAHLFLAARPAPQARSAGPEERFIGAGPQDLLPTSVVASRTSGGPKGRRQRRTQRPEWLLGSSWVSTRVIEEPEGLAGTQRNRRWG